MAKKVKGIRHNGSSALAESSASGGTDLSYVWPEAQALADELVELRRDFHMHPELSQQETRTAQVIADYLRKLGGIEVQEGIAGTGVVGLIRGGAGDGKTIMLRADIDGLPITEANDVPYRSVNPGVMHACGHDTHITVALAAARLVSKHRDQLHGNLKLCFQPAEERAGGAAPMIKQGVMQNPSVDRVIGFHVSSDLPVGLVAIRAGASAAGVEEFVITVKGRGGHAAHPDQTVDPIVTAAHIVTALQSIVARNLDPVDKAVVTVGKIEAGTAFNIIPDECKLTGTLRFFSEDVHKLLLKRVEQVAKGVAKAMGADADVQITPELTMIPVVNDPEVSEWMKTVAARTVGAERVFTPPQIMGADDMALFLKEAPGCYLGIGGQNLKKGFDSPHHSATFDIDEDCLPVALAMMAGGVLDYLHDLPDLTANPTQSKESTMAKKSKDKGGHHNGSSDGSAVEMTTFVGGSLGNVMHEAEAMNEELIELRRQFHMHPELSQHETETAKMIATYLHGLGPNVEVQEGIGGTGVMGIIKGGAGDGNTIMVRADIDGLPITEANDVPYRSVNQGAMHACGHDTHITVALATAKLVNQHRHELRGTVKFCFQPAEERSGGAAPMIKEGVMTKPTVDRVIGFHVWGDLPVGQVGIRSGPIMAGVEEFVITVKGRGGHGAHPDQTVDPIVTAAHIVTALQSIVARNVDPVDTAIVTVGKIEAGTAFNIIPDECKLTGTLRFFSEDVHKLIIKRVKEVAKGVAKAMGADADVQLTHDLTMIPVDNDPEVSEWMKGIAAQTIGADHVVYQNQTLGGDDMALFLKEAPGCYLFIGGKNVKKGFDAPHHNAHFNVDEGCLPIGLALMAGGVLDYLRLAES